MEVGDTMLIQIANGLRTIVDTHSRLYRLGNDEFVYWCPCNEIEKVKKVAQEVQNYFKTNPLYDECL